MCLRLREMLMTMGDRFTEDEVSYMRSIKFPPELI